MIEESGNHAVQVGDEWLRDGHEVPFVVVEFRTIFDVDGRFSPVVVLRQLEAALLTWDPSLMTVTNGWRLARRRGMVLQ